MGDPDDSGFVYVFHGHNSMVANAVFSTLEAAAEWIRKHELTGLLTGYTVDDPAFEKLGAKNEERAKRGRGPLNYDPERYTDGSAHWHFYLGLGEDDEGYNEAFDQWNAEHAEA